MGQSNSKGGPNVPEYRPNTEVIRVIDDPNYGPVKLVREAKTHQQMILKEFVFDTKQAFEEELKFFKERASFDHPNIVQVIGYNATQSQNLCSSVFKVNVYIEILTKELETAFKERKRSKNAYTENDVLLVAENVISALYHLQSKKMSHGDIRPVNIFLSGQSYKVTDPRLEIDKNANGLVKAIINKIPTLLSPQLLARVPTGKFDFNDDPYKADVFSLGATLLSVATMKNSEDLYDHTAGKLNENLLNERLEEVKSKYSNFTYELIRDMLRIKEQERPDFVDLRDRLLPHQEAINAKQDLPFFTHHSQPAATRPQGERAKKAAVVVDDDDAHHTTDRHRTHQDERVHTPAPEPQYTVNVHSPKEIVHHEPVPTFTHHEPAYVVHHEPLPTFAHHEPTYVVHYEPLPATYTHHQPTVVHHEPVTTFTHHQPAVVHHEPVTTFTHHQPTLVHHEPVPHFKHAVDDDLEAKIRAALQRSQDTYKQVQASETYQPPANFVSHHTITTESHHPTTTYTPQVISLHTSPAPVDIRPVVSFGPITDFNHAQVKHEEKPHSTVPVASFDHNYHVPRYVDHSHERFGHEEQRVNAPRQVGFEVERSVEHERSVNAPRQVGFEVERNVEQERKVNAPRQVGFEVERNVEQERKVNAPRQVGFEVERNVEQERKVNAPRQVGFEVERNVEQERKVNAPRQVGFEVERNVDQERKVNAPRQVGFETEKVVRSSPKHWDHDTQVHTSYQVSSPNAHHTEIPHRVAESIHASETKPVPVRVETHHDTYLPPTTHYEVSHTTYTPSAGYATQNLDLLQNLKRTSEASLAHHQELQKRSQIYETHPVDYHHNVVTTYTPEYHTYESVHHPAIRTSGGEHVVRSSPGLTSEVRRVGEVGGNSTVHAPAFTYTSPGHTDYTNRFNLPKAAAEDVMMFTPKAYTAEHTTFPQTTTEHIATYNYTPISHTHEPRIEEAPMSRVVSYSPTLPSVTPKHHVTNIQTGDFARGDTVTYGNHTPTNAFGNVGGDRPGGILGEVSSAVSKYTFTTVDEGGQHHFGDSPTRFV